MRPQYNHSSLHTITVIAKLKSVTCSAMNVQFASTTCPFFDQCSHSFRKPLPEAERIKVSYRKSDVFDTASLLAALNDGFDVQIKVGHVRIFLQTEYCADACIS